MFTQEKGGKFELVIFASLGVVQPIKLPIESPNKHVVQGFLEFIIDFQKGAICIFV